MIRPACPLLLEARTKPQQTQQHGGVHCWAMACTPHGLRSLARHVPSDFEHCAVLWDEDTLEEDVRLTPPTCGPGTSGFSLLGRHSRRAPALQTSAGRGLGQTLSAGSPIVGSREPVQKILRSIFLAGPPSTRTAVSTTSFAVLTECVFLFHYHGVLLRRFALPFWVTAMRAPGGSG